MLTFVSVALLLSSSGIHQVLQDVFAFGSILVAEYPLILFSSLLTSCIVSAWIVSYLFHTRHEKSAIQYDTEAPPRVRTSNKQRPDQIGILAMEVYFPSTFVRQKDFEVFNGVSSGKYTKGLGQEGMGFVTDREDINSISLTVVESLLQKYEIDPNEIGRLEIGTETLIDKSKSTKTVLMELFQTNPQLEGVTNINACYGGTAALLNSIAWVESSDWDGRFALVVAADIAVYAKGPARPTGGCGAVAMLIGPNAPLPFLPGLRTTHASNVWDFYKPDPSSEYPTVDGMHSQECYLRALDDCYQRFGLKNGPTFRLDTYDFAVFHSPYNKLVQKSFARLMYNEFTRDPFRSDLVPLLEWKDVPVEKTYGDRQLDMVLRQLSADLYTKMVRPSCNLSQQVGNCYTASVFMNLACLIDTFGENLQDKRVLMFSYGSGSMASMYAFQGQVPTEQQRFTLRRISKVLSLTERLAAREPVTPSEYTRVMETKQALYGKKDYTPSHCISSVSIGSFYLERINEKYQRTYARRLDDEILTPINAKHSIRPTISISGMSIGLPGQPRVFDDSNLTRLLSGKNCIEPVSLSLQEAMLKKKIKQLEKTPNGNIYHPIEKKEQGVQLSGQFHQMDLEKEYGIPKALTMCMDSASQAAVAAGLQALKHAGLVTGSIEQGGWGNWRLPDDLIDSTGIIFATSFPALEAAVAEVSKFYTQPETYEFNRKFLFQILVLANAQLAQITGARGPNTQINAACAGTTQAIGMAHDWIELGRCERVVVISSDTASGPDLMEWIGSGFRALGAASIKPTVETAALPFDKRRNGMILSSGAMGMVLERWNASPGRPIQGHLLASQYSNSAFHGASLDTEHIVLELTRFFNDIEEKYGLSREYIAKESVYFSHETFTNASAQRSCAFCEITALRQVFGSHLSELLITNTKGFTGHAMGVSFEDVACLGALKTNCIPPVVNFQQEDENLGRLNLSTGEKKEKQFAIRFAAGFGSQLALTFYSKA